MTSAGEGGSIRTNVPARLDRVSGTTPTAPRPRRPDAQAPATA